MMGMKERVLQYVREQRLLKPGDRVGVAVSGGTDSVALLRVLLEVRGELGIVVAGVLHFNHKLRGKESDDDERFVRALAEKHGLEFRRAEADTAALAKQSGEGMEAAARRLRHDFFADALRRHTLDVVATGHTLDDQAETVLMRLLRGAGTRGLAGILPRKRVELAEAEQGCIVRPLLGARRSELAEYLRALRQDHREDASNRDPKFLRNRIRQELLPLLERGYNPRIAETLAQTAEIARAEQLDWERQVGEAWRELARWKAEPGAGRGLLLDAAGLARQSVALQRRLMQHACERLAGSPTFEQVEAVRALAARPGGTVELPGRVRAVREGGELRLWVEQERSVAGAEYEYPLTVPGEVALREVGLRLRAQGLVPRLAPEKSGLALAREDSVLVVRNWRPGDRFHPQHSKRPKKVKELLTERKITGRERALWPVVAAGERIVWLRGWGMAADAVAEPGSESLRIEEAVFPK